MSQPLDEEYFTWLYSEVASVKSRVRTRRYWGLLKQLYSKEFTWVVRNDENRASDGLDLRYEFLHERDIQDVDQNWLELGCSVLEMLIGLSRRLSFASFSTEREPRDWFWILIQNIGLQSYNDQNYTGQASEFIDRVIDRILERRYDSDGSGGLFPLYDPVNDQRKVEIWYQLHAYLLERY